MTFFCARNRKKGCFRQFLPSRAKDSVWPVSPSVPVSAVRSASAAALRSRRFLVLQLRDAVVSIPPCRRPFFPLSFPIALHHSARRVSVERNLLLARAQSGVKRNLLPARAQSGVEQNLLLARARGYAKRNPLRTRAYYGWPCTTPR